MTKAGEKSAEKAEVRGIELSLYEVLQINAILGQFEGLQTVIWYAVGKNQRRLEAHMKEVEATRKSILEKFGANADGKFDDDEKKKEADSMFKTKLEGEKVRVEFYEYYMDAELQREKLPQGLMKPLFGKIIIDNDE